MKTFLKFLKEEDGASAGEYALILAIVGTAVAGAAFVLGGDLKDGMGAIGDCIANPSLVTDAGCPAADAG